MKMIRSIFEFLVDIYQTIEWLKNKAEALYMKYKREAISILIILPILVYILSAVPLFPAGANNDWAGFWGGYSGALIGAVVTLLGIRLTIEDSDKKRKEDKINEIRPYLGFKITGRNVGTMDKKTVVDIIPNPPIHCKIDVPLSCVIENIGLGHAIRITCNGKPVTRILKQGKDCSFVVVAYNESLKKEVIEFTVDIQFQDMRNNLYSQRVIFRSKDFFHEDWEQFTELLDPELIQIK